MHAMGFFSPRDHIFFWNFAMSGDNVKDSLAFFTALPKAHAHKRTHTHTCLSEAICISLSRNLRWKDVAGRSFHLEYLQTRE